MIINILEDIRCFKKGTVIDLSILNEIRLVSIVGENGSGKSTLIHALRGSMTKTQTESLYESDFKKLATNFDIKHEYDHIIFLDSIKDNPFDMHVSYDAINFITSGGMQMKSSSHGETSLQLIHKMWAEVTKYRETNPESKLLIVLDEVDKGFSISNQAKYMRIISNMMHKFKAHVIAISHNPFFINESQICYDMGTLDMVISSKYIKDITNYSFDSKSEEPPK